jgi:formate-dependent nitrite reductase membrane component NrfD
VAALLAVGGRLDGDGVLWIWAAPLLGGAFLAATGAFLIADLQHPLRFYMVFTRPQWRSWLVRGAFSIAGYSLVLALHLLAGVLGWDGVRTPLTAVGLPLAVVTAVYTAWLFAQARGRDLWQSPLLKPHFLVQTVLAGAATLAVTAAALEREAMDLLLWITAAASLAHLLLLAGEVAWSHPTEHARLAVREMTAGSYRGFFRAGALLAAVGLLGPWVGVPAALSALAGLLAYEHAHVQAAQSVPLA